jgi:hypothetical protein
MDPSITRKRSDTYYGYTEEEWLSRVKWYNLMNESSISEAMVSEMFHHFGVRRGGMPMEEWAPAWLIQTQQDLMRVDAYWKEHPGLDDLLC